jgi:hypothetical protein
MSKGFLDTKVDDQRAAYWETDVEPPQDILDSYSDSVIRVPLRPSAFHRWNGAQWVPYTPADETTVPDMVEVLALYDEMDQNHNIDLLDEVEAVSPKALKRLRIAQKISRHDEMVPVLQARLQWTNKQVDNLFIAAKRREAV